MQFFQAIDFIAIEVTIFCRCLQVDRWKVVSASDDKTIKVCQSCDIRNVLIVQQWEFCSMEFCFFFSSLSCVVNQNISASELIIFYITPNAFGYYIASYCKLETFI